MISDANYKLSFCYANHSATTNPGCINYAIRTQRDSSVLLNLDFGVKLPVSIILISSFVFPYY